MFLVAQTRNNISWQKENFVLKAVCRLLTTGVSHCWMCCTVLSVLICLWPLGCAKKKEIRVENEVIKIGI